jgi:hypothetical protein
MNIFMRNIAFAAKQNDIRIALAEKLHRPPLPPDPPLNFSIQLEERMYVDVSHVRSGRCLSTNVWPDRHHVQRPQCQVST